MKQPAALGLSDLVSVLASSRERLIVWHARRRSSPGWTAAVAVILAFLLLPVGAVLYLAANPAENAWPHLASSVLPYALTQTLLLASGTALLSLSVGTGAAWLVTMYRFPGRAILDRLLVLPLAMPTYIVAYCYAELLDYAGPVQSSLRAAMGWRTVHDYWFPPIRSLGGAVFVLAVVLYPYVYLAARASFIQQSVCALEVARTLGRTPMGAFWAVGLPLSRPALVAGVALVIMESLNDLGAVQHLGVETLSVSIYATWLQRSNLGGAAQLSGVLLIFIAALLAIERIARGDRKVHHTTSRYRAIPFQDIEGWRGYGACALCLLPVIAGFGVPLTALLRNALRHSGLSLEGGFVQAAWNSIMLATISAALAVSLGLVIGYARRVASNSFTRPAVRVAGLGYALPGTVLAIGTLIPLAGLDNAIDAVSRTTFGVSTGLLISGSIAALAYAYVIRFLAVALGGIEAGLERISPNLDAAARALGATPLASLWRVHLPLILPALGSAGLLVFVDSLKELPATLLLRPFNFETLATHVYGFAALEQIEGAALGALTIVLAGLVPLIVLHQTIASGRAGG